MLFGKKENKKGLPDLPPLRSSFGLDEHSPHRDLEEDEFNSLPAFPDSPNHNRFSQAAIKDAVADEDEVIENDYKNEKLGTVEMEEWVPSASSQDKEMSQMNLPELRPLQRREMPNFESRVMEVPRKAASDDVFVKIDKFHSAKKTLAEIQGKLEDIDSMIRKVREIKLREEQELGGWESDLMNIKSRMKEVSENIFEKA